MIVDINEANGHFNKVTGLGAGLAQQPSRVLYESRDRNGNGDPATRQTMGDMLEGLPEGLMRSWTALMLENTRNYHNSLSETTKMLNVGDYEKYALPIVRTVFPSLVAHQLVSVQPMPGPTSLVFFMRFLYNITKGSAKAGTDVVESPNQNYSDEFIDEEEIGVGDNSTTVFAATLAFTPVRPGTINISTVDTTAVEVTDDGNGLLTGDGASGTINYSTGALSVTFGGAPDVAEAINVAYSYDMEVSDQVPEIDLNLTSTPVVAKTRKLRTRWSLEAGQDFKSVHGLEAEVEVVAAIAAEIKFHVDREVVDDVRTIAVNDTTGDPFDRKPPSGISFTEHKLNFVDFLIRDSNEIYKATQRAIGTWVIGGINVTNLIESLPGFVREAFPVGTRGVYKVGVLNGTWDIFKDANLPVDDYLVGYKGVNMWETGYIYAPYILAFTTATIMLDDFLNRKGIATRYGKKKIDGRFYAKSKMIKTP